MIYDPSQSGHIYSELDFSGVKIPWEEEEALKEYPPGKETDDKEVNAIHELLTGRTIQRLPGVSKVAIVSDRDSDPYVRNPFEDYDIFIGYDHSEISPGHTKLSRLRNEVSAELDKIRGEIGGLTLFTGFAVHFVARLLRYILI